jgi:hypothetical protein
VIAGSYFVAIQDKATQEWVFFTEIRLPSVDQAEDFGRRHILAWRAVAVRYLVIPSSLDPTFTWFPRYERIARYPGPLGTDRNEGFDA